MQLPRWWFTTPGNIFPVWKCYPCINMERNNGEGLQRPGLTALGISALWEAAAVSVSLCHRRIRT